MELYRELLGKYFYFGHHVHRNQQIMVMTQEKTPFPYAQFVYLFICYVGLLVVVIP